MSIGLMRNDFGSASMTSLCTACGVDIIVTTFDGADDFCPRCALERIRSLEREADDLEHDLKDLQRDAEEAGEEPEPGLFVITASRPPIARERKARTRRFAVLAASEREACEMALQRVGTDPRWSIQAAAVHETTLELGAA